MKTYPKSFNSEKYPNFIRKSIFLKVHNKPEKVFSRIGLSNCEIALSSIKLSCSIVQEIKVDNIQAEINKAINSLPLEEESNDFSDDLSYLTSVIDDCICDNDYTVRYTGFSCIKIKNDSEDVFSVFKKLQTYAKQNNIKVLQIYKDKKPTINNICPFKDKNLKLCFSSDGNKGYWDTATMSMRGISSCMRWRSDHAISLVGTLIDPYAAIIYITNGKETNYGKNMLARAVVRFVSKRNGNPALLIEEVYTKSSNKIDISNMFKSFLSQKTNLPIVNTNNEDNENWYDYSIPITDSTKDIIDTLGCDYDGGGILSYRDSGIEYGNIAKFYNPKKVKLKAK